MLGGRFIEPKITAGVVPRVEIATDELPVRREPRALVTLRVGPHDSEMTVAQWQAFVKRVETALQQEGLSR